VPIGSIFGPTTPKNAESAESAKGVQLRRLAAFVLAVATALSPDAADASACGARLLRAIYATQHAHGADARETHPNPSREPARTQSLPIPPGRRRSPRRRAAVPQGQQAVEAVVDAACPPLDDRRHVDADELLGAAAAAAAALRALPDGVRERVYSQ
jgi:hypothetical protein